MQGRFKISKQVVLDEMKKMPPGDYEQTKRLFKLTEMAVGPTFTDGETGDILSPRQYSVSRSALLKCGCIKDRVESWWEIYDFVEAAKAEEMSYLELQVLCMLLDIWVCSFEIENV